VLNPVLNNLLSVLMLPFFTFGTVCLFLIACYGECHATGSGPISSAVKFVKRGGNNYISCDRSTTRSMQGSARSPKRGMKRLT
jgi:hypothetical protein